LDAPSLTQHRIAGVFSIDDPQAMMDALPAIAPVRVVHLPDGRLHIVAR
jgi:transmembrane sensor